MTARLAMMSLREHVHAELMGYPENWVSTFLPRVGALKAADIRQMPKRYLSDSDFVIVIVASNKELKNALANLTFSPEIKVLPLAEEP